MAERENTRKDAPAAGAFAGLWWLVSGFWLLLALAVMLEELLEHPDDIAQGLRVAAVRWLPWVFLTPMIAWLTWRCPLTRSSWHRVIGVYLVACALVVGGLGALGYFAGSYGRGDRAYFPHRERERDEGFERSRGPREHERFPPEADSKRGPGGPRPAGPAPNRMAAVRLVRLATFQLPTFWVVVLALHALRFYQQAKERERREAELESRLATARLQALRMQLNPHFLFNTLNSIASLVYENPKAADDMIGSLSDLLRATLDRSDRQEVGLREELRFLDSYLHIEQVRFGERLKLEKQIEPAALDTLVPILILQPLTENAVKHGLESQLGPGLVSIGAKRQGETLLLEVSDNGRGPGGREKGEIKEGVGLSNTRARLQALHGDSSSMSIIYPEAGGCRVEIRIPWRTTFSLEGPPGSASEA